MDAHKYHHGVLVRISPGYPPVQGRLHTCYSPVRRSPPKYCYSVMPLDLHVLSLSLAFILSQDQTLPCISFVLSLACRVVFYFLTVRFLPKISCSCTTCISLFQRAIVYALKASFPRKRTETSTDSASIKRKGYKYTASF